MVDAMTKTLVIAGTLILIGILLYVVGFGQYVGLMIVSAKLSPDIRTKTEQILASTDEGEYTIVVNGVVGKIIRFVGRNMLIVWNRKGMMIFEDKSYTKHYLFSICDEYLVDNSINSKDVDLIRKKESKSFEIWSANIKLGDYVTVSYLKDDRKKLVQDIHSIFVYDWWAFAPVNIEKNCEDRK